MPDNTKNALEALDRRAWLGITAAGLAGLAGSGSGAGAEAAGPRPPTKEQTTGRGKPTQFQIACMTLPYSRHPLERALSGLKSAGYRYVAWGTTHQNGGSERVPVMADDAPPERAKELGAKCRDLGLEPVMMFGPKPEQVDALKHCIQQAAAAGIVQVLTMGSTRGNDRALWVKNFKALGPFARDHGVMVVVKPHGGNTGFGSALAEVTREVADEGIKVSYDAGNVMDYHDVDPLPDFQKCADEVRSFCIKDHRNFPKDEDCGPGFGEIDHYRLLLPVAFTGRILPLCCENISAPLLKGPADPEGIDALARRAREFLEVVTKGLQAS
jgi:sugar phosphate isomerase/epimerase